MKLIFEKSRPGAHADYFPCPDASCRSYTDILPEGLRRRVPARLPELSELDVVRHYSALAKRNVGVDQAFYPLGSCTMKYNPKLNEQAAALPGFTGLHPLAPISTAQGLLKMLYDLKRMLCEIVGMDAFILNPMAGAHGEWVGVYCIRKFHERKGEINTRTEIIVPDSAHGTNPASASLCGFKVVSVDSDEKGMVDIADLEKKVSEKTAGLMLTNPNTLGIFEGNIERIADIIHGAGGLLYYDGANLNAICGIARPGDMGFDVVHLNVHKTFGTPHGGGGPGAGPVGVTKRLQDFLPVPDVGKNEDGTYYLDDNRPDSIGRIGTFYGNVGVLIRTYAYLMQHGKQGIADIGKNAVLNATYLKSQLKDIYPVSHDQPTLHEFVCAPPPWMIQANVHTLDIAKRLIDKGFHPMTIYFPHVVKEAMMIEPTETESKETLDAFVDAMRQIADEVRDNPDTVRLAPYSAPVRRVDEVKAAKDMTLVYHAPETP